MFAVAITEGKKVRRSGLRERASLVAVLALLITVSACVYFAFRASTLFRDGYSPLERLFGGAFLLAELFVFMHSIGFLLSILRSTKAYKIVSETYFAPYTNPSVTCYICSYNEPAEILEETIASVRGMDYRNKEVVLLDDSAGPLAAEARKLAEKYGIRIIHRMVRAGFKAGAINNALKSCKSEYVAFFDADQKPVPNFLRDLVHMLEADKKLALIQTPQFYANTENRVANAAWDRQSVFYEYVCEGKGASNAMFCCGSNFIARRFALAQVGYFDESTVTEDFATTLKLHKAGWKTLYYNVVYVIGVGPETLGAYFTQQYRWTHGTITTFRMLVGSFIKNPFSLRLMQWWEYLLSSTYFFTGWSNFIFMLTPVLFLLFGLRVFLGDPLIYIAAFLPYFILSMMLFAYSMRDRRYLIRDLILGQSISLITFSVYMAGVTSALLGMKTKFSVTSKGGGEAASMRLLWPQLIMLAALLLAIMVGAAKGIATGDTATWINVFWAAYHIFFLSYFFVYNWKSVKTEHLRPAPFNPKKLARSTTSGARGAPTKVNRRGL